MGVARIHTGAVNGLDGEHVLVEVDTAPGVPAFNIVGLPDTTVNEAKERVKASIKNAGFQFPMKRVIVNLAPADLRKAGSGFDLPIAVGIMESSEYFVTTDFLQQAAFVGELSLDGSVRPVKGVLAIAVMAKQNGILQMVVPIDNMAEASLVEGLSVYGLEHLSLLPQLLDDPGRFLSPYSPQTLTQEVQSLQGVVLVDFSEIKGQSHAKRALEIAAAGGHNIALFGPPGSGKSMLAKAFAGILPSMSFDEMLEVSRIYSVAGQLATGQYLVASRPFRSPHHSASMPGVIGGGNPPKPGEITLAHRGVLFLDEFTEFPRVVLEVLRQPLEDQVVTVSRAQNTMTFPANFILLAAMNPCPCGFMGDADKECLCSPFQVQRYLGKLSGPLMDRIDLQLEVPRLSHEALLGKPSAQGEALPEAETSAQIRERVVLARIRQSKRFEGTAALCNSDMSAAQIKAHCALDDHSEVMMLQAAKRFNLSARAFDRILKLARTIADLAASETIALPHVAEALQYRGFERLQAETQALSPNLR